MKHAYILSIKDKLLVNSHEELHCMWGRTNVLNKLHTGYQEPPDIFY